MIRLCLNKNQRVALSTENAGGFWFHAHSAAPPILSKSISRPSPVAPVPNRGNTMERSTRDINGIQNGSAQFRHESGEERGDELHWRPRDGISPSMFVIPQKPHEDPIIQQRLLLSSEGQDKLSAGRALDKDTMNSLSLCLPSLPQEQDHSLPQSFTEEAFDGACGEDNGPVLHHITDQQQQDHPRIASLSFQHNGYASVAKGASDHDGCPHRVTPVHVPKFESLLTFPLQSAASVSEKNTVDLAGEQNLVSKKRPITPALESNNLEQSLLHSRHGEYHAINTKRARR